MPAITPHLIKVLVYSCVFALANGMASVTSHSAALFYEDVVVIARCMWVYHYMLMLLSLFDIKGYGGRTAVIVACGRALDSSGIQTECVKIPFPFSLFHGCRSKTRPCTAFVFKCVRRTEAQIVGSFLLIIVKSTLQFQNKLFADAGASCPEETGVGLPLKVASILLVLLGLSGIIPLLNTITPLVLPERQAIVALRKRLYIFILPVSAAIQTAIVFGMILPNFVGACAATYADQTTHAVEMVVFQVVCHKAFVPMFAWKPWGPLPPEIFDKPDYLDNPHIQLVVPPSEMARVFGVDAGSAVAPSPVKTPL